MSTLHPGSPTRSGNVAGSGFVIVGTGPSGAGDVDLCAAVPPGWRAFGGTTRAVRPTLALSAGIAKRSSQGGMTRTVTAYVPSGLFMAVPSPSPDWSESRLTAQPASIPQT